VRKSANIIAVAVLRNLHPRAWRAACARPHLTLGAGLLATAMMFALFLTAHDQEDGSHTFWMTVLGYPLLAAAFALLVLSALSPGSVLARVQVPGARSLALWSYAIYLSHKALMHLAGAWLPRFGLGTDSRWSVAALAVTCVAVGWLLHVVVERPFMRLRSSVEARRFPARSPRPA
jgi:peptidoglycan/LPS O-acetylase OafA/YrhL